jgi:transcriptional regulator with XRE-family HTH domain
MPADPALALARRLRELRSGYLLGRKLTQRELADALGDGESLSVPLISSWESEVSPVPPPERRLEAYARLFCTDRSVDGARLRLLAEDELTSDERQRRDELHAELVDLRTPAKVAARPARIRLAAPTDEIGGGLWFYEDQRPVTVVCARLPDDLLDRMPYTRPENPDYVKLYTFADLDALLELYGHLRAVNPASRINIRNPQDITADDITAHLVILGGVDWNALTRDVARVTYLPVHQQTREGPDGAYDAYFEAAEGGRQFRPRLEQRDVGMVLREDVCHFFRGINPFNVKRTVTMCNGMFGRGTYGAVRALTDVRFRDRNEDYVKNRFHGRNSFSIVSRVLIVRGETLTPDWTVEENRLHEWPD